MARNSLSMILLLCVTFLAGWTLGSRTRVSAAAAAPIAPRMELVHGVGLTVQYGEQSKLYIYDSDLKCIDVITVRAPGEPATHGSCGTLPQVHPSFP